MNKILLDLQQGIPFSVYEDDLQAAVVLSLFCDARGIEANGEIGRGWWGDGLSENDRWGSRLWELYRSKDIPETLRLAEDYTKAALDWMLKDGVTQSLSVLAYSPAKTVLSLVIKTDNRNYHLEVNHALS